MFRKALHLRKSGRGVFLALAMGLALATAAPALGQQQYAHLVIPDFGQSRDIELQSNKSMLIDLPADVAEVVVSNPAIAGAIMRTTRRAIIQGVAGGDTNVLFMDAAGRPIAVIDLRISEPESGMGHSLEAALARVIPGSHIKVEAITGSNTDDTTHFLLTGTVLSGEDKTVAEQLVSDISGGEPRGSLIQVIGPQQVMLQVTVSEVKRDVAKQLGINLSGAMSIGNVNLGFNNTTTPGGFTTNGATSAFSQGSVQIDAAVRALETRGALRILAQPTLTAISGQSAEFRAGGQFPIPQIDDRGLTSYIYKDYGVALNFTPTVKSNGSINIVVDTSVSEVTAGTYELTDRSSKTTIELTAGSTLAIGGLLEERSSQAIRQLPGLGDIPILGALFRSRDYQTSQTELVILVTPYLVNPSPANSIPLPTDTYNAASDAEAIFLGQMEHNYGVGNGGGMRGGFSGSVGFVLD